MDINNELKVIDIKNRTWYYFDEIIKIESSDPDNILIDKKLFENVLFYNISLESLIDSEPLRIRFDKIYGFTRVMMELNIYCCLEMENMIPFTTGLDIL